MWTFLEHSKCEMGALTDEKRQILPLLVDSLIAPIPVVYNVRCLDMDGL